MRGEKKAEVLWYTAERFYHQWIDSVPLILCAKLTLPPNPYTHRHTHTHTLTQT